MAWISVREAAERLGVSERHVRRLAESGVLAGRRLGGVWLISQSSSEERARSEVRPGRPLKTELAWAVLTAAELVAGGSQARPAIDAAASDLGDRRDRARLRSLLAAPPEPAAWDGWLRNRAGLRRLWVHPGLLEGMRGDPRTHAGGAALLAGHGLAPGKVDHLYVAAADSNAIVADYRAKDDEHGPLILSVMPDSAARRVGPGEPMPSVVGLVDSLRAPGARERRIAAIELGLVVSVLRRSEGGPDSA